MSKFYFTYGSSSQPFVGGWTEVEAPDRHTACEAFRIFHPDNVEGLLNCSSVYSQEELMETEMVSDNFGARCHEYISLKQAEKGHCWHEEVAKDYKQHMRIALRHQQEAYFCLLKLLDIFVSC